jgi:hypothetical protein
MIDRLQRAMEEAPHEIFQCRMHGLDLDIGSNSPRILDAIKELLSPFQCPVDSAPRGRLHFQFHHGRRPDERLIREIAGNGRLIFDSARSPSAMDDWAGHFGLKYYVSEGLHLADYGDLGIVLTDAAGGRAFGLLADPDSIEPYVLSNFIFFLSLYETARHLGYFFIHAAGLKRNGTGLLIPGMSGSGKSTLTIALIRAGFGFLSDDRLILHRHPSGITALAFPEKIDVTDQTVAFFEELASLRLRQADSARRKKNFSIDAFFPDLTVTESRPGVILFPAITNDRASRIEPLDRAEAVTMLLPQGLLVFDPETAERHFQVLCDLVEQCNCYRIHFARDFAAVPRLVEAVL